MASYLCIQNKGIAPTESFTLLGASMSRDNASLIGQFGSGAKLAITALLREGLGVTIYCGLTRMEFKTKTITINDGIEERQERQVYVQFGGTSTRKQDLGWTLGFGALDWNAEHMAAREFVANAIDRTTKGGDNVRDAHTDGDLIVRIVDESQKRAQDGYTRIFIEANEALVEYVDDLPHRFLHFTSVDLNKRILPKLGDRRKAQIYLNGVFVRELASHDDSIHDYNFATGQITIDESRNLDEYSARAAVAKLYRDGSVDDVVSLLNALDRGDKVLETSLDSYYLKPVAWGSDLEKQKATWKEAWERVNGDKVACASNNGVVGEFARRKGYNLGVIEKPEMVEVVKSFGIPTVDNVLSDNERKGRVITAPTFEAIDALKIVWEWIEGAGLIDTEKCQMPLVRGFNEATDAESDCLGFYTPGSKEIHIRNDLAGPILLETVLEECVHFVTGAADGSRDVQNFAFRMIVNYLK